VIKFERGAHAYGPRSEMSQAARDSAALTSEPRFASTERPIAAAPTAGAAGRAERLRSIVAEHYASLWRFLRRLGVPEADAEDAAQKCLWVLADRIDDIALGKDKPFLFAVALRVAKSMRRDGRRRARERDDKRLADVPATGPDAGQQLDDLRARALLDRLLGLLPLDLRTVFILYEIEELTMAEIASALEMPMGTVASRLRRARVAFEALSRRLQRDMNRKDRFR
jgi:RNA polymerase sigma-70 factor, ECF subfamily